MENTAEQVLQNYWVERYEQLYGQKLRRLAAICASTIFPDKRELTNTREELGKALRVFHQCVKLGKLAGYVYDCQAIGIWILSLPAPAFPKLSASSAALYGISEELRRQRMGLPEQK
jgi:hypothetical protein